MGCPGSFIYEQINPQNVTLDYLAENNQYDDNIEEWVDVDGPNINAVNRALVKPIGTNKDQGNKVYSSQYYIEEGKSSFTDYKILILISYLIMLSHIYANYRFIRI